MRSCPIKWIKHDTDANQDNKLQNVLLDYGLEGYGLYWYCLELIGSKVDKDNITFELEHDARVIARNVGSTAQKVEEMMRYFVQQRLFEQVDNTITCLAMAKRLDKSMTSNPVMRQAIANMSLTNTVKEGYVYFIENLDSDGVPYEIKVGRSANPHSRFREHQKKYEEFGFNLQLIATIKSDDCVSLEAEIHRKLKDYSVRKEWFSLSEEVIEILRHDYEVTTSCKIRLDQIRLDQNRKDNNLLSDKSDAVKVLEHLNQVCGTRYKSSTKSHIQNINARLSDGYTVEECKSVIDLKNKEWGKDQRMSAYLRPQTLFSASKFPGYAKAAKTNPARGVNQIGDNFNAPKGMEWE